MFAPNIARVDDIIADDWKVLDVGGWYRPFNRADVVVDLMKYDSRGIGGSSGAGREHFSASSWLVHDISSGPLPFADNEFDYSFVTYRRK